MGFFDIIDTKNGILAFLDSYNAARATHEVENEQGIKEFQPGSPSEILGVTKGASEADIKEACHKYYLKFHSDKILINESDRQFLQNDIEHEQKLIEEKNQKADLLFNMITEAKNSLLNGKVTDVETTKRTGKRKDKDIVNMMAELIKKTKQETPLFPTFFSSTQQPKEITSWEQIIADASKKYVSVDLFISVIDNLIKHGIDVNQPDKTGDFLAHAVTKLATTNDDYRKWLTVLMDSYKLDINVKNAKGITPLHIALENFKNGGHYVTSLTKLLAQSGANIYAEDNEGISPYKIAQIKFKYRTGTLTDMVSDYISVSYKQTQYQNNNM